MPNQPETIAIETELENAAYCAFDGTQLVNLVTGAVAGPAAAFVHQQFRSLIRNVSFPCVGAKAAIAKRTYRFGLFGKMAAKSTVKTLAASLDRFIDEQTSIDPQYAVFIASFHDLELTTEHAFEIKLWSLLQTLADFDHGRGSTWDETVSGEPEDPNFAFSYKGRAFFIVGIHPAASRRARRFPCPVIVFNAHYQFRRLRKRGKFERLKSIIRERDAKLQGSASQHLADFGAESEAKQYSGRQTEHDWRCPFRSPISKQID